MSIMSPSAEEPITLKAVQLTPRQMGQVVRGFAVGCRGYGCTTVPNDETKYDEEGG